MDQKMTGAKKVICVKNQFFHARQSHEEIFVIYSLIPWSYFHDCFLKLRQVISKLCDFFQKFFLAQTTTNAKIYEWLDAPRDLKTLKVLYYICTHSSTIAKKAGQSNLCNPNMVNPVVIQHGYSIYIGP